jgi:signal transduction histidine kinase
MPRAPTAVYRFLVARMSSTRALDVTLVLLVVAQLAEVWVARDDERSLAVVMLILISTGSLLLRRRVALAAVLLCFAAHAALIQLMPSGLSSTFFALLVAVGVAGALPVVPATAGLLGAIGIAFEGAWLDVYGGGLADFAMSAAIMVGAWICGLLVSRARHALGAARADVHKAEAARLLATASAVQAERARMTRELHDVVAHGLTVLVVQSVAAQEDLAHGDDQDRVRARLQASEEVARESLHELRTLLGILGSTPADGDRPSGLPAVEALAERWRVAGVDVDLRVLGDLAHASPGVELATYRIVQEGLTNACKHGDGRNAEVVIAVEVEQVQITMSNPLGSVPTRLGGSGRGLVGLRERADLLGGSLEAGVVGDRYELHCRLPASRDAAVTGTSG